MKFRDSGMPEQGLWESLFQIELILDRLEIDGRLKDVLEIGCGYGTFSIPVARRISGNLTTLDIDPDMVSMTRARAEMACLHNLEIRHCDAHTEGFGVPANSQDACLLFNILHCEQPELMLARVAEIVRPGGALLAIHWRYDPRTPRGPAMTIRPKPEQIIGWSINTGMLKVQSGVVDLPPWHYGIRFTRSSAE